MYLLLRPVLHALRLLRLSVRSEYAQRTILAAQELYPYRTTLNDWVVASGSLCATQYWGVTRVGGPPWSRQLFMLMRGAMSSMIAPWCVTVPGLSESGPGFG